MALDRLVTDLETARDLLVSQASCHKPQDFNFASGQRSLKHPIRQPLRDLRQDRSPFPATSRVTPIILSATMSFNRQVTAPASSARRCLIALVRR